MSIVSDLALGTATTAAKRTFLPWLILAAVLALGATGVSGMYLGYEIATGRYAKEREALQTAQLEAMQAKGEALALANKRGDEVAITFLDALKGIRIVNTTINKEVHKEKEQLIYTDCNVPASGAALLHKNVDSVNMKLLGRQAK